MGLGVRCMAVGLVTVKRTASGQSSHQCISLRPCLIPSLLTHRHCFMCATAAAAGCLGLRAPPRLSCSGWCSQGRQAALHWRELHYSSRMQAHSCARRQRIIRPYYHQECGTRLTSCRPVAVPIGGCSGCSSSGSLSGRRLCRLLLGLFVRLLQWWQ
mgnify:FL=1